MIRRLQSQLAKNILEGMMLDLEGDKFADPLNDNTYFKNQFVTVTGVEIETEDCVRIDFEDADSVGFPLEHELNVAKDDPIVKEENPVGNKKSPPTEFLDLENPDDFTTFLHRLTPCAQDDAMGGIYAIRLGQSSSELNLKQLYTLESIKSLNCDMIVVDYGNSAGDAAKIVINIAALSAFYLDENPL